MKIHDNLNTNGPDGLTSAKGPDGIAAQSGARTGQSPTATGIDSVTLSDEARMVQEAAASGTAVRADVVARMRELVASGQVGADANALADAIIDNWIHGL